MNVFVTGGTGLIGSSVVAELVANGHSVVGLARSDRSVAALEAAGAGVLRGGLADLGAVRAGAAGSDGVVHLAFSNDFTSAETLAAGVAEEAAALGVIGDELTGSDRPLVTVSGTPFVPGRAASESDPLSTAGPVGGRAVSVMAALALAEKGVRSAAVRLPRTVYRDGTGGFAGMLTQIARGSGISGYVGDGSQRWPAVHAADAAVLFRLVLEAAPAGSSWHAVADEGVSMLDTATVIGRRLGVPVEPVPAETYGPLAEIFATDQPASSAHTRAELGWEPTHSGLLADLELVAA